MNRSDLEHAEGLKSAQRLLGKTVATIKAEYSNLCIVFTDGSTLNVLAARERWPDMDACAIACDVDLSN